MNVKKILLTALATITILFSTACIAHAYNYSFSYSGTGIQNLNSQKSAYIAANKGIRVSHTQKKTYTGASYSMIVSVKKKGTWGSTTLASKKFPNNTSGSFTTSTSEAGTYYLNFLSNDGPAFTFDISGVFEYN